MPIRPRSGRSRVVRHRKSCCSFDRAGMLEAEDLAALRIDPRHDVLDGAVFSGCIHRLENQQHGMAVGGIQKLLLLTQLLDMIASSLRYCASTCRTWLDLGRPFIEIDLDPSRTRKSFGLIFICDILLR